ncbi:hypothetical protein [Neorhizobium galegae]|uniref:hypothetical protein n=1 Tax=Neorhizobium galegae TaxID=399 RepID=UPI001F41CADD|nr:hypothetical protein [Neorhizobium galegae]UIK04761.1 hypothetical protein LZK81_19170 [Neorhizobium galegae]
MAGSAFSSQLSQGRESTYAPKLNLEGKQNFTRHVYIDEDGGIREVVRMNVLDDRHREDIVAFHFSRQYAEIHYRDQIEPPQFYVVGRDCPWDFEYVMHDGTTFYLEICRIAEKKLLKLMRAENDCVILLHQKELRGYEVLKVEKHFPGTIPAEIAESIKTKSDKQRHFSLGDEDRVPQLFLRPPLNPNIDLELEIRTAIQKKAAKRHRGKERTILVLDNLTTHSEPNDIFNAVENLQDFLDDCPFPSIWIYTGYYSDDQGFDCEYSLTPIKLGDREQQLFSSRLAE